MTTGVEDTKFRNLLIITHVLYRNKKPLAGPYTSVIKALEKDNSIETIKIPLLEYNDHIYYSSPKNEKSITVPATLGKLLPIKYLIDFVFTTILIIKFLLKNRKRESVVIGIDPLCTLAAVLVKTFTKFKLIFYCVDFNEHRFDSRFLQKLYEKSDEICSKYSDQTWAVCEALINYKKSNYNINAKYIPNSFPFTSKYYEKNGNKQTGNRVVWTGSILTDKQITDIMRLSKQIQNIRPEMEFWYIPSNKIDLFYTGVEKFELENTKILDVEGQEASRELVSQCDLGLAIYDRNFGSTKYIEPIKIWEYMMCGLPFIISCEPSLHTKVKEAGVAFLLDPDNTIDNTQTLATFINNQNLNKLRDKCIELAKEFDASKTMGNALLFKSLAVQQR